MTKKFIISVLALGLVLWVIYEATHIDYMGDRNSIDFAGMTKERNRILFIAEREAFPYGRVQLTDSVKMELEMGDARGTTLITLDYKISGDTIIFKNDLGSLSEFIHTNKLLMSKTKLLFNVNDKGVYDTSVFMKILKNKLPTK
jgi:hypothetical protein